MYSSKSTDALMDELMKTNNIEQYLYNNKSFLITDDLSIYLTNILNNLGLVKSEVIKSTQLSEVYGYQIFSGLRVPSRDALLCISIAMHLEITKTQAILKIANQAKLYPKNKRDSIIIIGINNNKTVAQINEILFGCNEPTLNK